jgi:hypothetical protein
VGRRLVNMGESLRFPIFSRRDAGVTVRGMGGSRDASLRSA